MQVKDYSREFLITLYNKNTTIIMLGENFTLCIFLLFILYFVINQEISDIF